MAGVIVTGQGNISARIIADSISGNGNRITTYELEYPRFFHSEVMTHRMLSKNAASSRAIPVDKMHETIKHKMALPVFWGKNQPGMKAKEELDPIAIDKSKELWSIAADMALYFASALFKVGNHKQISNRITEPFQIMKTVLTGTEFSNFFYLRNHPDAQPEFRELARCMLEARNSSTPMRLNPGQWHMPYVLTLKEGNDVKYIAEDGSELSIEDALKISGSCCAQVSYRRLDDTLEKAIKVFDMLNVGSEKDPAHASPLEHQAKVMHTHMYNTIFGWEKGVTHVTSDGHAWSGNFKGWIQHRKLIPNENR